jgi:hypothetical protein
VSQPNQTGDRIKVALCTREYPPEVYGGAGVHVEYLAKELSQHVDLTVHCQGADRGGAPAMGPAEERQPGAADDLHGTVDGRVDLPGSVGDVPRRPREYAGIK